MGGEGGTYTYAIFDTETCSCCSEMEHEHEVRGGFATMADALAHVIDTHDPGQLFEGLYDDVVIRRYCCDGADVRRHDDLDVLTCIKDAGMTLDDLLARKARKRQAAVAWLTPWTPREKTGRSPPVAPSGPRRGDNAYARSSSGSLSSSALSHVLMLSFLCIVSPNSGGVVSFVSPTQEFGTCLR